jgi:hypothetical protein
MSSAAYLTNAGQQEGGGDILNPYSNPNAMNPQVMNPAADAQSVYGPGAANIEMDQSGQNAGQSGIAYAPDGGAYTPDNGG